jgi:WhiB family transcriptional regulator, redox-sensing transcriptional regulator
MRQPPRSRGGRGADKRMAGDQRWTAAARSDAAGYATASATWMPLGACQDEDPELFFPIGSSGPAVSQVKAAKAVCGRCTVRQECLSYALRSLQADGIWGGTTGEERLALRKMVARHRPEQAARRASPTPSCQTAAVPAAPQVDPLAALLNALTGGLP